MGEYHVKITFYAHASFRLEADGLVVVTDPYTPGPQGAGFDPIGEGADLVVMSSATDRFHADPSHVTGRPVVVNALTLPAEGVRVDGLWIRPFPVGESETFDLGRDPEANAMYLLEMDGLRVLHMGDIGNPVGEEHLAALRGQVDVLLAPVGAGPTIALQDLDRAIGAIGPRIVIPMHYYSERGVLNIGSVEAFVQRWREGRIVRVAGPTVEIDPERLPAERTVIVLQQSR